MANQWGRKETIIWPPHVPVMSYSAVATAILCTCFFLWQRLHFSLPPLQRSYLTEYIRSTVGSDISGTRELSASVPRGRQNKTATGAAGGFHHGFYEIAGRLRVALWIVRACPCAGLSFFHFAARQKSSRMSRCTAGCMMRSMAGKGCPASSPSASSRVAFASSRCSGLPCPETCNGSGR